MNPTQQDDSNTEPKPGCSPIVIPGVIFSVVLLLALVALWSYYDNDQLLRKGLPGEAVVLEIEDTGNRYNGQPEVRLLLEITPQKGATFRSEARQTISPVYLPQFQPGAHLEVRYDPKNHKKAAIKRILKKTQPMP